MRAHPASPSAVPAYIVQDVKANRGQPKILIALLLFRLAQVSRIRRPHGLIALVAALMYRGYAEVICSFEIPVTTTVGPGLRIWHGFSIVVNPATVIGRNVVLRQGVTIGKTGRSNDCPVIGDDVAVGASATIVGGIEIGDGAEIGAHSLVTHDVPAGGATRAANTRIFEPRAATKKEIR